MKKKDILKMTGLTEKEFYERYPTEESFMMEYGGKIPMYSTGSYSAKAAAVGKDIGKPGKNFAKIAEEAGERYGSEEAGERVAGAILAKLRARRNGGKIYADGGPTGDGYIGAQFTDRGLDPEHMKSLGTIGNMVGFNRGLTDLEFSNAASRRSGIYGGISLNRPNTLYGTGALGISETISRGTDPSYNDPSSQGYKMLDWQSSTSPYAEAGLRYAPGNMLNPNYRKGLSFAGTGLGTGISYDNNSLSPYVDFNPELSYNFGNKLLGTKSKKNQPFSAYAGMDVRVRPFKGEDLYDVGGGQQLARDSGINERASGAQRANFYAGLEGRTRDGLGIYGKVATDPGLRSTFDGSPMYTIGVRKQFKSGGYTNNPTGDIFDMMGMSYVNRFQEGGDIDVKAPRYDETELPSTMNPDVYGSGSGIHIKPENRGKFTAWAGSRGMGVQEAANKVMANKENYSPGVVRMANFAKNAAGWNKNEMGGYYNMGGLLGQYGMGGNVPAYAFGDVVKKIGAGAYGVGEGLLDTVTMGATDQLTDMGYEGLQSLGGSKGKDKRIENMIRGFGTTAGSGIGAAVNPASIGAAVAEGTEGLSKGISNAAPNSQGSQVLSQFLPMVGNIASMFGGQNAMGTPMKNGGMTSEYMKNMPTFAQGGMTVGNVEARELLIDPDQYGGGGVPKVLTSYSSPNLPSHPKDGSIDDRGTVPLPEGKFIITQAESNRYKTAARSNDKLMADAITNNIQVKKDKKEAEQMQKASNAYERFMSKYGGTIQKMYACGGKTYGCGGSVGKYDIGSFITPTMGSSLSQGWNLGTGTLPSSGTGNFNAPFMQSYGEPRLNTPAMGSSLPQGWNLSKTPATVDASGMFDAYRAANPTDAMKLMTPRGGVFETTQPEMQLAPNPYPTSQKTARQDSSDIFPLSPGNKFGDYATMGMMFAPAAYNIGRGLFSKVTQVPKGLGMVNVNITAPRMTDAKGRREIREQMNLAKYNAGQLGGANILPGYATLGTAGMKAVSDYTENLRNKQAAMDYDAAVTKQKLELANAQQSAANWAMQQQMQAQKDNILAAGLGNLGEIGGQLRREDIMGNVYRDLYTNYDYINGRWTPKVTTTKLT